MSTHKHTWSTKRRRTWWLSSNYFTVRLFQVVIKADVTVGKCNEKQNAITPRTKCLGLPFPIHSTFIRNIWQFTNNKQNPFGSCVLLLFTCFGPSHDFGFCFISSLLMANLIHFGNDFQNFFPNSTCFISQTACVRSQYVTLYQRIVLINQPICWSQTVAIKINK